MTWIFLSPARVRTTSNVVCSSSAAPPSPPPAAAAGRRGSRDGGRGDAERLLERLDALGELEHRDALQLVDPFLGGGHGAVLLRVGSVVGIGGRRRLRVVVVVVSCVLSSRLVPEPARAARRRRSLPVVSVVAAQPRPPRPGRPRQSGSAAAAGSSAVSAGCLRSGRRLLGRSLGLSLGRRGGLGLGCDVGRRCAGRRRRTLLLADLAERDGEAADQRVQRPGEAGERRGDHADELAVEHVARRQLGDRVDVGRRRAPRRPSGRP